MAQSDTVVVLGGAGFIGRHLVAQLSGRVRSIKVVSRGVSERASESGDVRCLKGDVEDAARMDEIIAGAGAVFLLAVNHGNTWSEYERSYVGGARNVAEACLRHGVRRLVFTSTTDALYLGDEGIRRDADGHDSRPEERNYYSRGKTEAERLLLDLHAQRGCPVVIFRPALVVGPGGRLTHGGIGRWRDGRCCLGWDDGEHPMPFVLVQDVAAALVAALDTPGIEGKSFNLAGDVRPSTREYVQMIADRSLRPFRFYPRDPAVMKAQEVVLATLKRLLAGGSVERQSYRDIKSSGMRTQLDCSEAKRLLGWQPNASRDVFVREAIDAHLEPIAAGDPRLSWSAGVRSLLPLLTSLAGPDATPPVA
jgi:nucleoside-diphosphate-sugar epimerase